MLYTCEDEFSMVLRWNAVLYENHWEKGMKMVLSSVVSVSKKFTSAQYDTDNY